MPIRRTDDVSVEPVVFLRPWRVFRLDDGSRHLCGGYGFFGGRVSSAVTSIDPEASTAVTQTGRIYSLVGEPGSDTDTEYVWQEWVVLNSVERWDDITAEVWRDIQKHQQS